MFFPCLLVFFAAVNNVSSAGENTTPIYSSCKEVMQKTCNPRDGEYRVKTQTDLGYTDVFCIMSDFVTCKGGGWTLVLKIDYNKDTFDYNSPLWTNKESYHPSWNEVETKLPTYWSTPLSDICLISPDSLGKPTMFISGYQAHSLYHLIADGKKRPNNVTDSSDWLDWASLNVSNTPQDCVEQGFNIGDNMAGASRARFGILLSNVTDGCQQATHWAGVGVDDIDVNNKMINASVGAYGNQGYIPYKVYIYVRK